MLSDRIHSHGKGFVTVCSKVTSQLLRIDLRRLNPKTVSPVEIFSKLSRKFSTSTPTIQTALCSALPILTTWETTEFLEGSQVNDSIRFMMSLPEEMMVHALQGLGELAGVVLDRRVGHLASN